MITPEIISYVKKERAQNTPDSLIRSNLLANGWSETDVAQVMSSITSQNIPQPLVGNVDMKEHRKKAMLNTFYVLIGLDVLIIIGAKLFYGTWGVFGISPLSIILRVLVIYLISSFAVRGSSAEDKTPKTVLRIIGTILLTIIIAVGIFFVGCLFLLSSYH